MTDVRRRVADDDDRVLRLLGGLAHDRGATLRMVEGLRCDGPAGTPSLVPAGTDELDGVAAAAVELLLHQVSRCEHVLYGLPGRPRAGSRAVLLLGACARITGWLLPTVSAHGDLSRLRPLYVQADGLPAPGAISRAGDRLREHLVEHDRGRWVPPLEVAAAVADVVDAAVLYRRQLLDAG